MKQFRRITFIWISLVIVLGLVGCNLQNDLEAPLAPTLGVPTNTPPAVLENPTATLAAEETAATPTIEPVAPDTICGQSGAMTILFVGSDVLGSSKPNGADAIRIMKVNFDEQTIKVVTMPRDLLIKTASVNDASKVQQTIGLTFYEAFSAAPGTPLEKNAIGARVLAQLILENFAVRPDYYVTLQMNHFASMVDTIGGIQINVPATVTTEHNITFTAGVQTLDGKLASEYVRFINPGGEEGRTARQNAVIYALQDKVLSVDILPQIPALIAQFKDAVITDLSVEQLASIGCLAAQMPKENIAFGAITSPDLMINNVPNIEKIKTYLTTMLGN